VKKQIQFFLLLIGIFFLAACAENDDSGNSTERFAGNAAHLIINQYYGANYSYDPVADETDDSVRSCPVSHSFIELYNPSNITINLNGYSLQYADVRNNWKKLDLVGTIPPHCSFLVRGNPTMTWDKEYKENSLKLTINYDQVWLTDFNSKGSKVVLLYETQLLDSGIQNPFNTDGMGTKVNGYIDMLGIGGNDPGINDIINGYETNFISEQSKQKAFRRIDFKDTDNNEADFDVVDYRREYITEWAKPRTVSSGPWTVYNDGFSTLPKQPNEIPMDQLRPYTLHSMFGEDPKTTWNFTWQTLPAVTSNSVQILEADYGSNFNNPLTKTFTPERTSIIDNDDPEYKSVSQFKAKIDGLKPGTKYNYRIGSRINNVDYYVTGSFKTEPATPQDFTFIHISDSQSSTASGYRQFGRVVSAIIEEYPDLEFFLETGDLIETVDREDEWRGFFDCVAPHESDWRSPLFPNDVLSPFTQYALVPVVGNHDQALGNEAASFRKHLTVPNNGAGGKTTPGTTYSFNYGNVHFVVLNTESNLADQKAWLENDLKDNKQKWIIVAMHKGVYMQGGKSAFFNAWASTLDSYEVDLVLNGHDHVYVRTYPMRHDQKTAGGTIYLQTGGSGKKQGAIGAILPYQEVQDAPHESTYSAITVTNDRIIVTTKKVNALDSEKPPTVSPFYKFEIIKAGNSHSSLLRRNYSHWQEYRLAG